ncbi:MAG: TetR/AcrR family transcriptional regulator [Dinoroseobacter sp.]|nr:TetR/AcrR family transcriptional regulator [Dinoroseobacter sp.]
MATKQHLLAHAEDLARRQGYDGFSFADLAAGAGIRKASVHHHFPTKAALSTELVELYAKRSMATLRNADGKASGARLAAVLALYRTALDGGRSQCLCVAFGAVIDRLPDVTRAAVAAYQADMLSWLEQVFSDAAQDGGISNPAAPAQEAAATFALLEGSQLMARAAADPSQFDLATAPLRARIQTGGTS